MKYYILFAVMFLFSLQIQAQKIAVYDNYTALEKAVLSDANTTYVVNFWATWCAPCVKELPHFEQLNSENKNVKVVLVSLDFKNQYEAKLLPFLKKKAIKSEVVLLTDKDYNTWLPAVDKDWSGSIPATLIIKDGKKVFVEKMFASYEELDEYVNSNIN
ncbi:TlpA disulfide reductase family protein [Flavobacterium sp. FZUC8N2.13]|uniref:TlpA disulfide reductase family protein n=1 Tax=Flavobacterium zubiriense TaxID=3138075 RepID=A0ABV4THA2_9FLAO